jgi:hypothetical protein
MSTSSAVDSYLQESRLLAAVAVLALVAGILSDALARDFWSRHAVLANLAASLIVVMLTVAVVNEVVERRRRRRWRVLAQYVMLELALRTVPAEWWAARHGRVPMSTPGPDARRLTPDFYGGPR